jgi:hypothetical protein
MKTLQWIKFFESQRERYGKIVFSVTELANAAQTTPRILNVELNRLVKRGVIQRYTQGRYGSSTNLRPEDLLPYLDASAYLTGPYALHRHNVIMQVPVEITCFTNRRHNRSRTRLTSLGKFVFVCVNPKCYAHPAKGKLASPEQALCDALYLANRAALQLESLVTFLGRSPLSWQRVSKVARRYPEKVLREVKRLQDTQKMIP